MRFEELNLHPDLQRGIAEAGYVTCMPVQEQVLVNAFNGQDLYVQSQTGTGKTAAFLIVIFQRLLAEDLLSGRKAIIMVPTRELAVQVEEEAKLLGKYLPFGIGSFYGGVGYVQQEKMLRDNVRVLVGTPGRVLDLNKSGKMNLMDIAFLVLDEADRMFDMGFYPDLRKLIRVVPPADRRQTMLFSATLNTWVKNLAWEYTKNPYEIEIKPETVTVEEIEQVLYHVPSEGKMRLLLGMLEREKPESAIIFCNTKRYTEIVAKRLRINGYQCEFLIGDLPQSKRLKIIDDLKAGNIRYLVATDVAARGLDIEDLAMVVNYDLPVESENYVHRIGRTARAGKTGKAVTLASEQDVYELPDIEKYIGKKIPSEIAGEELYGEDKSAGMRIHTDFFGGGSFGGGRDRRDREESRRGEGRDRAGGGRAPRSPDRRGGDSQRDAERQSGGSRHGPVQERQGRRDRRREGTRNQHEPAGVETAPQDPGLREAAGSNRGAGGEDISKLSFDQRMAYYKRKYEKTAPDKQGKPDRQGREGEGGSRRRKGAEAATRGRREKSAAGSGQGGQKPSPALPGKAPGPAQPAPPETPAGKGLLGRILGIFRKKT
ncbi:MAG: DEAD/DEAH box helicase [Treponema sp.]|jgi:ATP-dependent RNA helicase RhlB|nr:DEAD/DEAH box helicase [Treponema sp.]